MPGIVGFCGIDDPQVANKLMTAMLDALRDEDGYKTDLYVDANLGLARIHLDIIDRQPQPVWSVDSTIALVMDGEIHSWHGLQTKKSGNEPDFSNSELLLSAYSAYRETFVEHINGTFAAAIWNAAERTLLLVSDHLGCYPIYYTCVRNSLVFGSGARAVAQAPGLARAVNHEAMAEMVALEQVYGEKTLFAGVQLLPPGTILRFCDGRLSLTQYVDFQYPEYYEIHDEQYYIDGWIEQMHRAMMRQSRGPGPLGVLLTGGLDSRSIVGMIDHHSHDVRTITFGIPGCDDEIAAREMAYLLHLSHTFLPLAPDYLKFRAAKGVRITDGMKSCVHLNMIGVLDRVTQEARVLYKGYLGGTIHGYVVSHERLAPVREEEWFEHVFGQRNRAFKEPELTTLYSDAMYRQVHHVPRQSLRQSLSRSHSSWWVDKYSYIDLYEEDVRFTLLGVQLARSQALVRTPLADKDLLRFALTVPPGYRVDKSYYLKALIKALPDLAKIPYAATGRPLDPDCFRALRIRTVEQSRWWLQRRGLHWIPARQTHPYADYANWFRHELRPWVEETLLSAHALDRGYFQPAFVRNLVAEHMAGCEHTHRLGVLLALELWHQQYMD